MASVSYEYHSFSFNRPGTQAVTADEYDLIRKDYDTFLKDHFKTANDSYNSLPNPHRFKWKIFFIFLTAGLVFLGADFVLKAMGYYDAGEIFAVLSFFPFLAIVIQPVQWLLSSSKGAGVMARYEAAAEKYFDFHASKIKTTKDYAAYLGIISGATLKDFENSYWEN